MKRPLEFDRREFLKSTATGAAVGGASLRSQLCLAAECLLKGIRVFAARDDSDRYVTFTDQIGSAHHVLQQGFNLHIFY